MPTIDDVARSFTAMLRAGHFEAAGMAYWAQHVTGIEPTGCASASGITAMRTKYEARFGAAKIDEIVIDGPFVTGDQFALFLDLATVNPKTGGREPFTGIALYTVREGLITEERYFYE